MNTYLYTRKRSPGLSPAGWAGPDPIGVGEDLRCSRDILQLSYSTKSLLSSSQNFFTIDCMRPKVKSKARVVAPNSSPSRASSSAGSPPRDDSSAALEAARHQAEAVKKTRSHRLRAPRTPSSRTSRSGARSSGPGRKDKLNI